LKFRTQSLLLVALLLMTSKILTPRGYAIEKAALSVIERAALEKELTVSPQVPKSYLSTVSPFRVYLESEARYYLPVGYARAHYGEADADIRSEGSELPTSLKFSGSLRPHQVDALAAFRAAGHNGIICLPCGYGKTFTGIAAATADPIRNSCFLIVVHKEFLADQWAEELKALVPGIRIGRIQGERCDLDVDVSIAMIQTICSRSYPAGTFDRFGMAIFDEVHHLGAEHFSKALQRINCRRMLGLTATPKRVDGLSKVFEWHLGPIVYQILRRPKDDTVIAEAMRYECDAEAYAKVRTDWKGDVVRAVMINNIAEYTPRTNAILEWVLPYMADPARKLLILSDRREHLMAFEGGFKAGGIDSVGYYVGGMKQKDLDASAEKRVILGTFAMASEGMNIPTLNMVLLATPKSNIEQSVGRILRQKKEDRVVQPMILDVVDTEFVECMGQWAKRKKFYRECGYIVRWRGSTGDMDERKAGPAAVEDKKGVPSFVSEEDDELPTGLGAILTHVGPVETKKTAARKKKSGSAATSASAAPAPAQKGTPVFVDDDSD
jgi:superfamily II DNA or RNA helicase